MIIERPSAARGLLQADQRESRHAFSFGGYYDPAWMGFGALRVVHEARVGPDAGFETHRYANMDILSVVLSGALAHPELDGGGAVQAGQWQWIGAGHGLAHGARNASAEQPLHFLQFWIQPDRLNARPACARAAPAAAGEGEWSLLASRDGADGGLPVRQDLRLYALRLGRDGRAGYPLDPGRSYWLQILRGEVEANGRRLQAGDALGLHGEAGTLALSGLGEAPAELVWFDLPPLA
ncbi:pirin family protein [Lysobacter sp. BMK333-48F3]|uniref:pirin family protein n=1 Tax=Lysobacter sp. BMK333-48F3 TaxID=2867962 RepID=UPI001C8B8717|nr:pirin family protein [Lysobacter sp. BMK333-48F3]MBX9401739.1 pirin family protein [Lysobacter sp. BMK333-48F3]